MGEAAALVAVTMTLYVPAGVPVDVGAGAGIVGGVFTADGVLALPPQAANAISKTTIKIRPTTRVVELAFHPMPANAIANTGRKIAIVPVECRMTAAVPRACEVMVTVVTAATLPPGVTVAGVKLQAAPVGNPLQENETLSLKPPDGVMVAVKVADCPAFTVAVVALRARPKSRGGAANVPPVVVFSIR